MCENNVKTTLFFAMLFKCVSSMIATMLSYLLAHNFCFEEGKICFEVTFKHKIYVLSFCIIPFFVYFTLLLAKLSEMSISFGVLLMILNYLLLLLSVNLIIVYAPISFRRKIDDNFKHIFLKTSVTLYSLQQRASIEKNNGLHCPKWHLPKKRLDNNLIYEPIVHTYTIISLE